MERKDRSHYRVRKFRLGDPVRDVEVDIENMSPGERIELVMKLSEMAYLQDPHTTNMNAEERRLARKRWPVKIVRLAL